MYRQTLVALLSVGLVLAEVTYLQDVVGLIEEGVPFRVVCSLNTSVKPSFNIKIAGLSANNDTLFSAVFMGYSGYQMILATTTPQMQANPNYTVLIDDKGIPRIPMVMAYGSGEFTFQSAGKGISVNTTSQAEEVQFIYVLATGSSIADCTYVQCFINRPTVA